MKVEKRLNRFICGMSRGGTTWLGKCFVEHPDCVSFGETLYWGRCYVEPDQGENYSIETAKRVLKSLSKRTSSFSGDGPGSLKNIDQEAWCQAVLGIEVQEPISPGDLFLKVGQAVSKIEGKEIAIEKTPHHVNWIGRILGYLPESKFVIMVRDPYSFMLSYKHQGLQLDEKTFRKNLKLYHPISCAIIWKGYAVQGAKALREYPDRCIIVKNEELSEAGEATWAKIQAFFDVNPVALPNVSDKNSSFSSTARKELDAADVFWMNTIAGPAFNALGYEQKKKQGFNLDVALSIVRLIPWSVRVFFVVNSRVEGGIIRYGLGWLRKGKVSQ